jgi:hypothetical protein
MARILILVMAWFLSGTLTTWSLGFSLLVSIQVGLISLIIALIYLALVILPIEYNRRLFLNGSKTGDEFYLHVGCLWYIPLAVIAWVPLIWIIRSLF